MAYVKIIYQNSPSTATPINAQNLNHMDDGIAENDRRLNELETAGVVNKFNGRSGNVNPTKGDYDIADIGATDGQEGYVPVWRNSGTEQEPNWGFEMEAQGGAGHVLVDSDGNDMPSEDRMQFADAFLTDDDVNGKTVVENIKEVLPADYDSTTDEGIIVCDDGEDAVIHPSSDDYVEVTADGNTSYTTLFNNFYSQSIDRSKLRNDSVLVFEKPNGTKYYSRISALYSDAIIFSEITEYAASTLYSKVIKFATTGSFMADRANTTDTVYESQLVPQNTKITLHYGNKKAVVDLQTTANRCWMGNGETVQSTIDGLINGGLKMFAGTGSITVAPQSDSTSSLTIADIKQASGFTIIYHILCNFKENGSGTPALLWYSGIDSKFHSYGVYSGGTYNNIGFSYVAFGV